MAKRILATKMDILEFIMKRELVWAYELEEKFRYSHRYVPVLLHRLKKAGLIINMTKGCWELTEEGYRRLRYYGRR
jgi:Mn-dependent DtxR family transcriptional regulator